MTKVQEHIDQFETIPEGENGSGAEHYCRIFMLHNADTTQVEFRVGCSCQEWLLLPLTVTRYEAHNIQRQMIYRWRIEHGEAPEEPPTMHETDVYRTGQCRVSLENEDYVFMATEAILTKTALSVVGYQVGGHGDPDDMQNVVYPAHRVRSITPDPWMDLERAMLVEGREPLPDEETS